ncbi:MAG: hypothetical protein IIC31_01840 [Chloroflexi bacterium]|nr:hypothetical protein [Chloroflexota bacterium]
MGELLDKLERASRGAAAPLGFAQMVKREKIAPMLLLGALAAGDAEGANLAADGALDGTIVVGTGGADKAGVDRSAAALKGTTFGVWLDEAQPAMPEGADFGVFSSETTPASALSGNERTTVMHVVPELDDSLLRTIENLPVDAFLVSLADAGSLTVRQLMRLARVRGVTSRPILVHVASLPTQEEIELLRDAGAGAVVVDLAGQTAASLKALRDLLDDLPHEAPKRRKGRGVVTLGSPPASASAPSRREPEPDEDDDDDEP